MEGRLVSAPGDSISLGDRRLDVRSRSLLPSRLLATHLRRRLGAIHPRRVDLTLPPLSPQGLRASPKHRSFPVAGLSSITNHPRPSPVYYAVRPSRVEAKPMPVPTSPP